MLKIINFHHLSALQIITITVMILLIIAIIVLTFVLIVLSTYKNKQLTTFKNMQYIQNVNIKEKLNRVKQIVQINEQYSDILNIWINRYQLFLKKDLFNLFKSYKKIIDIKTYKELWKKYKSMNKVYNKSNILKHQMQLLSTEIDYFISIDQLLREYQLFFKQNFNYLQEQTIKINLQNNLNQEQLAEIIKIINDMFKDLELNINDANFTQIINILNEIAIAIVTLTEILDNLPILSYIVTFEIKQKMSDLKNKCTTNINKTLLSQYEQLSIVIDEKLSIIFTQINNLQYKKAKTQTQDVLQKIANFNDKINKEQIFYNIFKQNYERFLVINFNFNEVFQDLKKQIHNINQQSLVLENNIKVMELETIISKQLSIFNHFDNLLIVENQKSLKTNTYQALLLLLCELFENSIIVFNSLSEYNKLLNEQNKPKFKFKMYVNKINSMMLQIDNILNNINYYYLNKSYEKKFNNLQQLINDTITSLKNSDYSDKLFNEFNNLQNKIFQLFSELKMEIIIHKLSHLTLIYANRHRTINEQLKTKFDDIEHNINNNHYQKALTLLLELME